LFLFADACSKSGFRLTSQFGGLSGAGGQVSILALSLVQALSQASPAAAIVLDSADLRRGSLHSAIAR